jgi:capsular exopolysaccharide synthesis family protein
MNYSVKPLPLTRPDPGGYPPSWAPPTGPAAEEDGLDIRALLNPIWRWKWLIAATTIVTTLLAILVMLNLDPRYTASARVIFDPERLRIIDLDNVIVSPDTTTTGLQNQIEILRSSTLLERVIDSLRLETAPEFNPSLRTTPVSVVERAINRVPLPVRVKRALAEFGIIGPLPIEGETPEEIRERLRAAIIQDLIDDMRLRPIPNSRVIDISFTSTNRGLAAAIVNTVAEQYIVVQLETKRDDVAAATELLSVRVRDLENRLNAAEEAVEIARLDLAIASGSGFQYAGQQLDALNTSLAQAKLTVSDLELRLDRARAALEDDANFWVVGEFRASQLIQGYRVQENELVSERASLALSLGESNPAMVRLDTQIAEVRRNIRAEAEVIVASLASDLESARRRQTAVEADLKALEDGALERTRAEMRLQRLERDANAVRLVYETFLNRLKETSEQASLQTSDARFLTRASPPEDPDTRSRQIGVVMAALAGMGLGVGIVLLIEHLNSTFRSPSDLEKRTGQTMLAAIPIAGKRRRPKQVIAEFLQKPNTHLAEAARNLRTSILHSNLDQPPKVVMFTSTVPGEGKTTTAMLVAITSRQMGRSAVIVDCDLRQRTVARMFAGDKDRAGLFAVLEGTATVEEAIVEEAETGLHVLTPEPSEIAQGNPADILSSLRFRRLIQELRARYDIVILDTPPALVVTDARIVGMLADAVVYLVRWGHTNRNAVQQGLRELGSVNSRVAGVALTMVDEAKAAKYVDNEYYYKRKYKNYVTS